MLIFSKRLFISKIPAPAQKREMGITGTERRVAEGIKVDKEKR
jgi:hypothetical protein